ncbi:MAG: zf-HC2 domain-containing protein [Clostridia bacterium]|nr:zf-HC2 domain-containing protein [Clostridia bacterium]
MKTDCEVIRDLLPLYADDVCSGASKQLVKEHLPECPECAEILKQLQKQEIETDLRKETSQVITHQAKQFKRRSTTVGSVISGIFMIPILVCLIVNLASGAALTWFFVVLGGLAVAASLILVPVMAAEDKLFWTFCAFTVSLIALLSVCCWYSGGDWFFIAASATLFGLSVVGLPFVLRAGPVKPLIGDFSRPLIVASVDVILFANMMNMISMHSKGFLSTAFFALLCAAGLALLINAIITKRGENK